jgi:hypothetical protein
MNNVRVFAAMAFLLVAGLWPALAQGSSLPSVIVKDQSIVNNQVIIPKVVSDGPGWLVIHLDVDGKPGAVIGYAAVHDGVNTNVAVTVDSQKATDKLFAMLHTDKGTVGVYEFPGPDVPVFVAGVMVNVPFAVLNASKKPMAQGNAMQSNTW